jgi:hypothetical protein
LCPAQPASECAGVLWPAGPVPNHGIAGNIDAGLQKIGCGSGPLRSVGHDLTHAGSHRVGIDDVLDRVAPVVRISGFEGARRSKRALTGPWPRARSQPCAATAGGAPAAASVTHARPHRAARQGCAVVRARTPAKMHAPAGVAARQSVRASAGWRGQQDRGGHRQRACRRTCPVANWTGQLSSQTLDVHRGGGLFRARVRARGSVRKGSPKEG